MALRDHLFDRMRERKITVEDVYKLKLWRESEPEAPDWPVVQGLRVLQDVRRGRVAEDVASARPDRQGQVAVIETNG